MPDFGMFIDKLYLLGKKNSEKMFYLCGFLYIKIYLLVLLVLNAFNWLSVYWVANKISNTYDDIIILHYNVDFGVNLIQNVRWLFVVPSLGLVVTIINFFLLLFVFNHKDRRFVAHLLLSVAILVNVFLLISIGAIFLINYF